MRIPDAIQPYMLSYSAEGATERARPGLTIAYVVGHELGHASTNRLLALARGQEVRQEIDYRVELQGGRLVATGGVTRATFTEARRESGSGDGLLASFSGLPAGGRNAFSLSAFSLRELESLKAVKSELEQELLTLSRSRSVHPGDPDSSSGVTLTQRAGAEFLPAGEPAGVLPDAGEEDAAEKGGPRGWTEEEGLSRAIRRLDGKIRELRYRYARMDAPLESGTARREEPPRDTKEGGDQETRLKNTLFTGAVDLIRREIPPVVLIDGFGSALRVRSAVAALREIRDRNEPVLAQRMRLHPSAVENRLADWDTLKDLLGELERSSTLLLGREGLTTKKAVSSDESVLTAAASSGSGEGSYSILVERLAAQHRVASDVFSDPSVALGLSGTITINDFSVSIGTADSLRTLAEKINWGEDRNRNGVLDYGSERDANENGITESGEDSDGNGMLDSWEDHNFDRKLDGGALQHGVNASLAGGRLILTSSATGKPIRFGEENRILKRLGILRYDTYPLNVTVKNELQAAVKSRVTIDGTSHEQESNELTEVIPGLSLSLKSSSSSAVAVSVGPSAEAALANIKSMVSAYNRTIEFLNDRIGFSGTLSRDRAAQGIRVELKHNATDPVDGQPAGFDSLAAIGVGTRGTEGGGIHELSLLNLYTSMRDGLKREVPVPSRGSRSLYASIDDPGITTHEDDTLSVDEEKLVSLLLKYDAEISRLFTGSGGVFLRLKKQLDRDLDTELGTIALRRATLGATGETFDYFQRLQKFSETLDSLNRREKVFSSTLSVIA